MKNIFRIIHITIIFLFFTGIVYPLNNHSRSAISELKKLRNNVVEAINNNDSLAITRAYYKLALKYDYLGMSDSCNLYYDKALSLAQELKNNKAIAVISNSLATTYSEKGLHREAIKIYTETIKRFLSLSDTSNAAGVMLNIASEHVDMGQYQKALEIALDALDLKLQVADSNNIAAYYQQIGVIFNTVGNKEKWFEYTQLANSLAKKNEKYGDFYRRMDILNELGGYYIDEEDYVTAKKYYDTLYTKSAEHGYLAGVTTSLSNLVSILEKQKKYSEALKFSQKALTLSEQNGNVYKIIHNMVKTARLENNLSKRKDAESKLIRAKELSVKFNYPSELIAIYKLLSEINYEKKNYKSAYNYLKKYQILQDSIKSSETQATIAELETRYQTEKKDNKIALLNKENQLKQKRIELQSKTVTGLIILGVLVIALFILFYRQTKLKSENRILNMYQKLLRTQMNPHFIFNALIAIQNYILKNKKFEASDYLSQFASLMRTILESSREDFIPLDKEIELLKYYVSLQQLRFENSFQFDLHIDENIDIENMKIPPMLIQPFLENAIEHGLRKSNDENKVLSVQYSLSDKHLIIKITDNGIGIENSEDNSDKKHKSYAMKITQERLTNIDKIYNENIDISIRNLSGFANEKVTEVKFSIPLTLLKKDNT